MTRALDIRLLPPVFIVWMLHVCLPIGVYWRCCFFRGGSLLRGAFAYMCCDWGLFIGRRAPRRRGVTSLPLASQQVLVILPNNS